tara:strand:+ start:1815 stop:2039 length:225 start_codon:yes stop_codon:yes gene_type:complete
MKNIIIKIAKIAFVSEYEPITLSSQYVPIEKYENENKNAFITDSFNSSKSSSKNKNIILIKDKTLILYGVKDNV